MACRRRDGCRGAVAKLHRAGRDGESPKADDDLGMVHGLPTAARLWLAQMGTQLSGAATSVLLGSKQRVLFLFRHRQRRVSVDGRWAGLQLHVARTGQ